MASPEPLEVLDAPAVLALLAAGFVVVAAGGGGIPHVRQPDGSLHGIGAVLDKDLTAALLARTVGADVLVIATDVEHAVLDFGTDAGPAARPGRRRPSCGRTPPPGSSRAAAWGRRSRPWSASSSRAGSGR